MNLWPGLGRLAEQEGLHGRGRRLLHPGRRPGAWRNGGFRRRGVNREGRVDMRWETTTPRGMQQKLTQKGWVTAWQDGVISGSPTWVYHICLAKIASIFNFLILIDTLAFQTGFGPNHAFWGDGIPCPQANKHWLALWGRPAWEHFRLLGLTVESDVWFEPLLGGPCGGGPFHAVLFKCIFIFAKMNCVSLVQARFVFFCIYSLNLFLTSWHKLRSQKWSCMCGGGP